MKYILNPLAPTFVPIADGSGGGGGKDLKGTGVFFIAFTKDITVPSGATPLTLDQVDVVLDPDAVVKATADNKIQLIAPFDGAWTIVVLGTTDFYSNWNVTLTSSNSAVPSVTLPSATQLPFPIIIITPFNENMDVGGISASKERVLNLWYNGAGEGTLQGIPVRQPPDPTTGAMAPLNAIMGWCAPKLE